MNRNNFIQKVGAILSDHVDGDTVLLVEQNLQPAINSVTRRLVDSMHPSATLLLTERNVNPNVGTRQTYKTIAFGDAYVKLPDNRVHRMFNVDGSSALHIMEPVQSLHALELAEDHNKSYYHVEGNIIYYKLPTGSSDAGGITLKHYEYLTIDDGTWPFPDELEDMLIAEIISMVGGEAQKKAVDEAHGKI